MDVNNKISAACIAEKKNIFGFPIHQFRLPLGRRGLDKTNFAQR